LFALSCQIIPWSKTTAARKALIVIVFSTFVAVRIVAWNLPVPSLVIYGDAYMYYVPAGIAYLGGALPDSINPEHPPLGKYIIGLFAVYFHSPNSSSVLSGFLSAVVAFLIAKKLTSDTHWSLAAVWLLAFDFIGISVCIHPMLDAFMLLFAFIGLYLLLIARNRFHYGLAGLMFGLAVASKWTALFFAIPALAFVLANRRYLDGFAMFMVALGGYMLSYIHLIVAKGFSAFVSLQIWMAQFMLNTHGAGTSNLLLSPLSVLIFHSTTFAAVSGYDPFVHPEAFRLFGIFYISFAEAINPLIVLALFPVLCAQARKCLLNRDRARLLILFVLSSLVAGEIAFPPSIALWYYAPVNALISIFASDLLSDVQKKSAGKKRVTYLYLVLVATWFLYANAIAFLRVAHYQRLV